MLYGGDGINTNGYRYNQTTSRQLDEPTQKLFKAIDDGNLENFKQALAEGADVNAFDAGYTPLMTIIMRGDGKPICLRMMMLLLQHQNLNVNIQETKERNTALHLAFCMGNRNFIRMLLKHPKLDIDVKNSYLVIKPEYQQLPEECLRDSHKERFFHTPEEYIRKIGEAQDKDFSHLTVEIQKAQRGEQLLNALSDGNINQAKALLEKKFTRQDLIHMGISPGFIKQMFEKQEFVEQMLNPNIQNGEIETPLSLIIKSCLQGITQDNKEVLTKLLKHKDLDFSQIKPIQAIEQNSRLKKIIEQAITERLTDTINRKDLEDVKELVEDNCFMNRSVVVAALSNVNDPIESITNYLNEKFPASAEQPVANTHNVQPEINDEFIARELQQLENLRNELERTKAQLTETEQELDRIVSERASETIKILQLERDLRQVKQEKLSQQTKINDLNSELIQCKRIVSERASETSRISQLKRDLAQVRQEKAAQQDELIQCKRIVYGRANDTVKISQLERDLRQVREERNRLSSENRLLRTKSLSNKNEKSSEAISPGKKQSNYASACFILLGVYAVGGCLVIEYSPEMSAFFAAVALVLLLVGCYSLYKANTVLSDVKSTQLGDLERS